jgi:hypothetical protein
MSNTHPVPTPVDGKVTESIRLITGGWLGSALIECDVIPTVGQIAWKTRKINQELEQLFAAHLQAAVQAARVDELQRIVGVKATLNDIYGDDPRNNYGYNETQVRDAANWLMRRHEERLQQLKKGTVR